MRLILLAQAQDSYTNQQLESLLDGFGKITFIGVIFLVLLFLILCVSVARRLGRWRDRQLQTIQDNPPEETASGDVWSESARRVEMRDQEDLDEDDTDHYGKEWTPDDDDPETW